MKILQWILIGILLGAVCFLYVGKCSTEKKNTQLSKELLACQNAPKQIDTVYDTIRPDPKIVYKPSPKPKPNDYQWVQGTTTIGCNKISPTYYSETYKEKGIRIHWEASTSCSNDSAVMDFIKFSEIVVPTKIVYETKLVDKPVEVPAKLKSKFLLYGGAGIHSFNEFPAVECGVGYIHKQSWGVMVGPMYADKAYGSIKIFVTL